MKILIIEDNFKLRENISKYLKLNFILSEEARDWVEWIKKILNTNYDVIILDINMPNMNWREFIKEARLRWNKTPVLVLTSNSMLDDKLEMFNLWADDYITKPFELAELLARIKALSKRKEEFIPNIINIWSLKIDLDRRKIFRKNKEVELGNKEFRIIEFLVLNRWLPKNKIQILEHVWWEQEERLDLGSVTLEAHISYIRRKLWKDFIKTIKWVGYVVD